MKGITLKGHVIRGLAEEDPHNLLFRDIFLDTAQLAGIVMDMDSIDETKVCVYGGSMGGEYKNSLICKIIPLEMGICDGYNIINKAKGGNN